MVIIMKKILILAVASTVGRGDANIGLGNKKASMQVETIDFIPLQTERYD